MASASLMRTMPSVAICRRSHDLRVHAPTAREGEPVARVREAAMTDVILEGAALAVDEVLCGVQPPELTDHKAFAAFVLSLKAGAESDREVVAVVAAVCLAVGKPLWRPRKGLFEVAQAVQCLLTS